MQSPDKVSDLMIIKAKVMSLAFLLVDQTTRLARISFSVISCQRMPILSIFEVKASKVSSFHGGKNFASGRKDDLDLL